MSTNEKLDLYRKELNRLHMVEMVRLAEDMAYRRKQNEETLNGEVENE